MDTLDIKNAIKLNHFTVDMLKNILAKEYDQPIQKINYMVKNGDLIALKRGVYVFSEKYRTTSLNYISIANIIHQPSYVSFEYALSYHGLIPERVYTITSASFKKSIEYSTPLGNFSYQKIPVKAYSLGIDWKYNEQDGGYFIATVEKALCDKIYADKRTKNLRENEVIEYLEEDLRIEYEELLKLDSKLVWYIAMGYGSKVLLCVANSLKRIQNNSKLNLK
jgi:predicted transcriptional regulator of viral defense system